MKLKQLLNGINEVVIGPPQNERDFNLNDYKDLKEKIGRKENLDIFEYKIKDKFTVFSLESSDIIYGWVGGFSNAPKQYIATAMWIDPLYRGKGYGTVLLEFIFKDKGWILISDDQIAPAIGSIFTKLAKIFPKNIKIVNFKDGKEYPYTDNTNTEFYDNKDYRIVLEDTNPKNELSKITESITKTVFSDYIRYTSKEAHEFWKGKGIELL